MKFYIQVMKAGKGWQTVAALRSRTIALDYARTRYANPDNLFSRGVMAVRVVKGKRNPTIIFEKITS